jgi:imidazolonepropionase-like amidohydrolase
MLMKRLLLVVIAIVWTTAQGTSTPRQDASTDKGPIPLRTIALVNANVVDVRTGDIRPNATVILQEEKIASIGTDPVPAGAETIDLERRYLLPGLIDSHTHLASLANAKRALESGVTTVRTAGVPSFQDISMRELVREGYVVGPDVVASGVFVTPNLGESVMADPKLSRLYTGVNTPEELRYLVRLNLAHGVDCIKTRSTEPAGNPATDPRKQVYTESQLRIIVEEAAAQGIPVQCHAHGEEGAMAAVKAGVTSIEHGTYLSEAALKLMKEKGTFLVPTYSTVLDLAEPGGDYDRSPLRNRGAHMLVRLETTFRRAHELGIKIATGADTYYGPESLTRVYHEIINFTKLGMSPLEAIQSATIVGAELLHIEDTTGAIEVGLEADLIAVEGNPLEDVRVIQDVLVVINNGRVGMNRLPFKRVDNPTE